MSRTLFSSNILRVHCCRGFCLLGPQLLFQSPVQELGMHIFNALNLAGQHVSLKFLGKHAKYRQNLETVFPLLHLVFARHMEPVNKLGGFGPACTAQRSDPKVI